MALNHLHSNWGTVMHMIFNFNLENTCDSDTTKPKKDDSNSATITSQTMVTKLPLEDVPVSGIMNTHLLYNNHSCVTLTASYQVLFLIIVLSSRCTRHPKVSMKLTSMNEPERLNYAAFGALDTAISSVLADALNPISQANLRDKNEINLNVYKDALITVMETSRAITMYVTNRKGNLDRTDLYCTTAKYLSLLSAHAGTGAAAGGASASLPLSVEDDDEDDDDDAEAQQQTQGGSRRNKKKVSRTNSYVTSSSLFLPPQKTEQACVNQYNEHAPPTSTKGGYLVWKGTGLPYVAGDGDMKICLNCAIQGKRCSLPACKCSRLHVRYESLPATARANLEQALATLDDLELSLDNKKSKKRKSRQNQG